MLLNGNFRSKCTSILAKLTIGLCLKKATFVIQSNYKFNVTKVNLIYRKCVMFSNTDGLYSVSPSVCIGSSIRKDSGGIFQISFLCQNLLDSGGMSTGDLVYFWGNWQLLLKYFNQGVFGFRNKVLLIRQELVFMKKIEQSANVVVN